MFMRPDLHPPSGMVYGSTFRHGDARDLSSSGRATTLLGNAHINNTDLEVDGSGDWLDIGDDDLLSFTDGVNDRPFSVSIWWKLDANAAIASALLTKFGSGANEYGIYHFNSGGVAAYLYSPGGYWGAWANTLPTPLGVLHHAVVSYDGSGSFGGIKIRVNGVRQVTLSNQSGGGAYLGMVNGPAPVAIGAIPSISGYHSDGLFYEVRVYDRELTTQESTRLYQEGPQ